MYENNLNFVSASRAISKLNKVKGDLILEKDNLVILLADKKNLSSLSINARKVEIEEYIKKIDPVCTKIDSIISSINTSVSSINKEIEKKAKETNNNFSSKSGVKYADRGGSFVEKAESKSTKIEKKDYNGYRRAEEEKY